MKGKDLTERVYREIKRDLMLRKFPSSELFSEQMLADMYHCSRTPAREAAGRLVTEGFLNKYPSKGYIVRLPTDRELNEMRYCRYILEAAAIRQSFHIAYVEEFKALYQLIDSQYTDPELAYFSNMTFHYELAKLSGNETIVAYIERLLGLLIRGESAPAYWGSAYLGEQFPDSGSTPPSEDKRSQEHHRQIVEALINHNLKDAICHLCMDIYPNIPSPEEVNSLLL